MLQDNHDRSHSGSFHRSVVREELWSNVELPTTTLRIVAWRFVSPGYLEPHPRGSFVGLRVVAQASTSKKKTLSSSRDASPAKSCVLLVSDSEDEMGEHSEDAKVTERWEVSGLLMLKQQCAIEHEEEMAARLNSEGLTRDFGPLLPNFWLDGVP